MNNPEIDEKMKRPVKLTLVYVLIAALFLMTAGGFFYLYRQNQKNLAALNASQQALEEKLIGRLDSLGESQKISEQSLKTVEQNLGTLQQDHQELEQTITEKVNAVSVAQKCANAVFYIEMYDEDGDSLGSGSGFFIESSGVAVTNYHVIDGCSSASVMLANGSVYDIVGVYDYNIEKDIALIQVDGEGFDILPLGDSDSIVAGEEVYAIGSPSGLDNTISSGIISNVSRYVDGMDYIQFTAPISCGSSGGALLDANYSVIGITSAYWIGTGDNGTQNLNLAIPISLIGDLEREGMETLSEVYATNNVFSDAFLYVSDYYVILPPGGTVDLTVYESTGDPDITLHFEIDDDTLAQGDWGDWTDDNTCEFTLQALGEGSTIVRFYLLDANGEIICTDFINVDITDSYEDIYFVCDPQLLSINKGQTSVLTFTQRSEKNGVYLVFSFNSTNIECEWNDWTSSENIELSVTGLSAGTDTITVSLFDSDDNFIKSVQIPVQVE